MIINIYRESMTISLFVT